MLQITSLVSFFIKETGKKNISEKNIGKQCYLGDKSGKVSFGVV